MTTASRGIYAAHTHTLKIWMVDPGAVLDRMVIATAALPYTYEGPPETAVAGLGSQTITNGQTVIASTNETVACDNLTNNGTLTLLGGAQLNVAGQFVNNGLLDLITWQGTLPAGFINNGTVLDRAAAVIDAVFAAGNDLRIAIQGYAGHNYQLQQRGEVNGTNPWTDLGDSIPGANALIVFDVTNVLVSEAAGFYRVFRNP